MNTGGIVALFVCILGSFLILSGVFLVYKWRAGKAVQTNASQYSGSRYGGSVVDEEVGTPEMQQYRIRRGRMVPKAQTQSVISSRSGWQTLKHATILFDKSDATKSLDSPSTPSVEVKGNTSRQPSMASMSSVPPAYEWRSKLKDIQTPAPAERVPAGVRAKPALSIAVSPSSLRRNSKRSLRMPRSPRDPPMCVLHEIIHELETPATDVKHDPSPLQDDKGSSGTSSQPEAFQHSPSQNTHGLPSLSPPKPAFVNSLQSRDSKHSPQLSTPSTASFIIDAGVC